VFEAVVHRARIDEIRPCKLSDSPQTLKRNLSNNFTLPVVQLDEPMNGTADLENAIWIKRHDSEREFLWRIKGE
jgi:hypothetical protein